MIRNVTIINPLGERLVLDLMNPVKSGFIVESIEGLGPVKADVNFTELATSDGALDNSARLNSRNIVLNLIFQPHPTIEDTRLLTYKYFPVKKNITFIIETDRRKCQTTGRIESNEPDIFNEQEGCQISILCPSAYFYTLEQEETVFYGTDPLFEFEFSNESLTDDMIEFGEILVKTEYFVYYEGDDDVGITIELHSSGDVEGLSIYNIMSRELIKINDEKLIALVGEGIKAGDTIVISTVQGKKSVELIRSGKYINILNALDRPISWFQLTKGYNQFAFTADYGLSNLQFLIKNEILYEGI